MLFERIESKGLAHYSYIIGDGNEAAVIDPRRDCEIYVEKAAQAGCQICHIMETHRNEDYVIGSVELAAKTGAEIWHADGELDYKYGQPAKDSQKWRIGRFKMQAISTPGHTPGSMSYLLYDPDNVPWAVFTGDSLFAGDIGRVDLPGLDIMHEMANLMYDSIFNKLMKLDDGVLVYPGHGFGSVCGTAIAGRMWTTIGIERKYNPKIHYRDKSEFVKKIAEEHDRPPYFRQMEKLNLEGAPILGNLPIPPPLSSKVFAEKAKDSIVLDTRSEASFGASHVPNSLSIWLNGVPSFAGWFLPYDKPILLINDLDNPDEAVRRLIRLGYDNLAGYLKGEIHSWHTAGLESETTKMVTVHELCHLLDDSENIWILDVRKDEEVKRSQIPGAYHIPINQIPERKDEIPKDRSVYIFCGSGSRSMVAASLLQRQGWENLTVVLGGLAGWSSVTCSVRSN